MIFNKGKVGPVRDLFSGISSVDVDITIMSPSYSHAIKDSLIKFDVKSLKDEDSDGVESESESPDFTKLVVLSGMYLGSFDSRLCREMRPYAAGSVESADGTWMVVWNLRFREDRMTRLRKAVEAVAYKSGKVMIVCTHRQRSRLAVMSFGDLDCVHLVTKKWLNGMLSNHDTLRELVLKYRVTPSFEVTNATRERFDRYLAPIEGFLKSKSMPSLVVFINSGDHVTSIREVYNMGIPVAALCDVDASWNTFVDYAIPFPSRADAKSDVIMAELETREYAQSAPRFVFMTLVRYAIQEGVKKRIEEESSGKEVAKSVALIGKPKGKASKKGARSRLAKLFKAGVGLDHPKWWARKRRAIVARGSKFDRVKHQYDFFEDAYLHLRADMELGEKGLDWDAGFLSNSILECKLEMDKMVTAAIASVVRSGSPIEINKMSIEYGTDFTRKRKPIKKVSAAIVNNASGLVTNWGTGFNSTSSLSSTKGVAKSDGSAAGEVVPIEVATRSEVSSSVAASMVDSPKVVKTKESKVVKSNESKVTASKEVKSGHSKDSKAGSTMVSKPVDSKPKSIGGASKGVDKKEVVKSGPRSRKGDGK